MKRLITAVFVFAFLPLLFSSSNLFGQLSIETSGIISSESETPFWFQSNRNGIYSKEGSQFLTHFQYHDLYKVSNTIDVQYGTAFIARPGNQSTLSFNQGYLKVRVYEFEFAAGRFINPSPIHHEELGMGSLGISTNATPIPKIKFGLADWTGVPFTNKFLQVRGYIAHGWLGSGRYTEDVLLHEKAGYLKIGGDLPVNVFGGLVHFAQWGGNNHPKEEDIPNRWSDFKNILFVRGGDESTPGSDQAYALGNHLGAWGFGSIVEMKETDIIIYLQSPIETKYDLKLKNMHDILAGISLKFSGNSQIPVTRLVYEYLYTKNQGGPRRLDPNANPEVDLYRGNQNYYNHEIYRTGWADNFRTIGNPLFKVNEENLGIVNNRIVGHHVGFESTTGPVDLFGKITFSRNYGKRCDNRVPNLGEQELFGIRCENKVDTIPGRSLEQWSFLAGAEFPLAIIPEENITLRIEAAFDNGRLFGDQFGLLTSIRWIPQGL